MANSAVSSASIAPRRRENILLFIVAGLLLAGEAAGLVAQFAADRQVFVTIALIQAGLYAIALLYVLKGGWRGALLHILLIAAIFRLVALAAPVFLSTDINRYVWDGWVQGAGINPYRYIPTDAHLQALRDPVIFPHINRNNYARTIYPPAAEMLFFLATRFGGSVLVMKLVMVLLEAVGIAALIRVLQRTGRPPETILAYAWHPLPIWQIAGAGHVDAALVCFVGLALAAAIGGRRAWSGAALGAATLIKYFPAALAASLWRRPRDWRFPAAFLATILALYVPYLDVGTRVLGFLPGYFREERLESGGGIWLLDLLRYWVPVPTAVYLGGAVLVMAALALAALRPASDERSLAWAAILATAMLLIVSPHYPWYFVWLVALLAVAPRGLGWWPAMWLTLSAPLLDWHPVTGFVPHWVGDTIYGGFGLLMLANLAFLGMARARHVADRRSG